MRTSYNKWIWITILVIAIVVVVILVVRAQKSKDISLDQREDPYAIDSETGDTTDLDNVGPLAMVENVSIEILESFPVQARANISGQLNDGCTQLADAFVEYDEDTKTFKVRVTTSRDEEAICTQALVPFNDVIPLDVLNLPRGTYTVDINGVVSAFTLDTDNFVAGADLIDGK